MPAGLGARGAAATPGPMVAADGTPLKASLARSLRRQKMRALLLIAPLLLFIVVSFVLPIGDMLLRSVQNGIVPDTLPRTVVALRDDPAEVPGEAVFEALYADLVVAEEYKVHTQLGSRLNYEMGGASSMFRGAGRAVGRFGTDIYAEQFEDADPALVDPARWAVWMADPAVREALPRTADAYDAWAGFTAELGGDDPAAEELGDVVYAALYRDLASGAQAPGLPAVDVAGFESVSLRDEFIADDAGWGEPAIWDLLRTFSPRVTAGYYLNAVDLQMGPDGVEMRPEGDRIYLQLFVRTMILSVTITATCILLGYPVAFLLASLPMRSANLLMILVLLPFWTSLLVRTSAWKVLLQQQGVINDLLVWAGLIGNDGRLALINNQTGTIIAMTHILLPFMILPLYSVMKGIPPTYVRAAKSLGANDWTAFWRVYFPQSIPGIGAGSILVFILAIGYYITPELVGGTKGVFISNRIAYHISDSLNWGLAAALGTILLAVVLLLYWAYDRMVGIDNVKLGG
ncbi:ABC transporter permease [Rubellimicrobium aerolatum]|uniref:ABC transporter permease n=1 Tax=Rubellimicrobium aerolatum TaxID=490979 RepID=A0ABW0SB75_9RHOB|nr:ABC transporter permease [Rubellimicrobium aerolatum]